MGLEEYNSKRIFESTPEPSGISDNENANRFVIQRHNASHLHYDLRLEIEGVLKSWAVPKGPSMNPKDKRLAIQTEDHPVKYLYFEGTIPKGNYGAGEMQIWDSGNFAFRKEHNNQSASEAFQTGNLKLDFHGEKIKGAYALVHTQRGEKKNQWLLIKKADNYAVDLEFDAEALVDQKAITKRVMPVRKLKPGRLIKPMLATATDKIFDSPDWIYEIKWDGYRIIAQVDHGDVELYSRNGIAYANSYPSIARSLGEIDQEVILDGELVVVDKNGISHFQRLQNYNNDTPGDLIYYVFDMLYLNGHSMAALPLTERKSLITHVIEGLSNIRLCDDIAALGTAFYNQVVKAGAEGVIAKKADSIYEAGQRSANWLKIRASESSEFLICGYTISDKRPFGSLVLGIYRNGSLVYTGNCGTGFSENEQQMIVSKSNPLKRKTSPFDNKINLKGRTPEWLRPQLICEVRFSEWTESGSLRHPVYKGLRTDKTINEITPEKKIKLKTDSKSKSKPGQLDVGGVQVDFTHLDKVYWPESGLRKYDLIDYYLNVAGTLLPYLKDRPQNLHRHPNGIVKKSFYQKNMEHEPTWVKTIALHSSSAKRDIDYLLCQNEATLLYMANLGCIEINPWNSRTGQLDNPDYTVIDIDPSEKNTFEEAIEVAQSAHEVLKMAGIEGYCKTSGSSGLHVYIPLGAKYSYDEAMNFTKLLCYYIKDQLPKLVTMERAIKKRKGRIYLDYLQNRRGQTLASVYSVRPRPAATVSTPLLWKEVKHGLSPKDFTIKTIQPRIKAKGDLFAGVLDNGIDMEKALGRLDI